MNSEMVFLTGVKKRIGVNRNITRVKLDRIKCKAIREDLQVFNLKGKLKVYKRHWKERLQKTSYSRLAKEIWQYKPKGHRCVDL